MSSGALVGVLRTKARPPLTSHQGMALAAHQGTSARPTEIEAPDLRLEWRHKALAQTAPNRAPIGVRARHRA